MKFYTSLFLVVFLVFSCNDNKKKNRKILSQSSGLLNQVLVVSDLEFWESDYGNQIREDLATEIVGLPHRESKYNISHLPTKVFSGFVKKNRLVVKFSYSDSSYVLIKNNVFAKPQVFVEVFGNTRKKVSSTYFSYKDLIKEKFLEQEIKSRQEQMLKSPLDVETLEKELKLSLVLPSNYRIAKVSEGFSWIRSDVRTGSKDLIIKSLDNFKIGDRTQLVNQLIEVRDSIGKNSIPGPLKGTYMGTETAYTPYLVETDIKGELAYEIRGIWDMKNDFMAGPFLGYLIEDKPNNRYLYIEGFLFAPSLEKRNYIFEIESIIKSLKLL